MEYYFEIPQPKPSQAAPGESGFLRPPSGVYLLNILVWSAIFFENYTNKYYFYK